MNTLKNVVPLFVILFICTLDGYSMMNYRLTEKRACDTRGCKKRTKYVNQPQNTLLVRFTYDSMRFFKAPYKPYILLCHNT